ncbi:3'-5' exonuclease (plasmid) [Paenibacillus thiaminolyticus]|uniref:3'-5' exonuclease n=1 Tax=Paenibacillus thiaminolyticus TaxID=49283 RepID=UPI00232E5907|nr:3'-5' exonuclease [Paenibacillus thiaminolyticus]WCF11430.1 3'-5' exonuclease [Paenibacillus thiaminolyticus]
MNAAKKMANNKAIEMNDLLLNSKCFVVGDIETTTFSPAKGGRIIEVAGVKIQDGKVVDRYNQLIDPELKIPAKITELTRITNEMVGGKPVFGQVLPEFYQFIGDAVFVAHNAMFDWDRFLTFYFKKVGILANNPVICTKNLAKLYFPYLKEYSLASICNHSNVLIKNHHRALDDSLALAEVLMKWKETEAPKYGTAGSSVLSSLEVVQHDLFGEVEARAEPIKEVVTQTFKVKRVSYWEKVISKQKKMQRIYALLSIGTVYFDIPSSTWYNKDVKINISFEEIEGRILRYLSLNNREDLKEYRGVK